MCDFKTELLSAYTESANRDFVFKLLLQLEIEHIPIHRVSTSLIDLYFIGVVQLLLEHQHLLVKLQ